MASDIKSNVENIYQVVQNFANQLAEYERKMESECLKLANAIGQLGSGWQAGDYDKFADSINSKITMIRKELSSTKKLKEYLDKVAVELQTYLNQLRKASE